MAFVNGWRSMVASALGMDSAPEDKVAVMSMRAAANQFGYLLGAAAGGLALALAGFPGLGFALAGLFAAAVLTHARSLPTPERCERRPGPRTYRWTSRTRSGTGVDVTSSGGAARRPGA